jgi:hypothetical protein
MTQTDDVDARIRFGAFEADLRSGELFREGRRVPLPNQSFLALSALLEQPGQLVSREALRARQEVPAPLGGLGISVSHDEHWLLYTRNAQWQGDVMVISGQR